MSRTLPNLAGRPVSEDSGHLRESATGHVVLLRTGTRSSERQRRGPASTFPSNAAANIFTHVLPSFSRIVPRFLFPGVDLPGHQFWTCLGL